MRELCPSILSADFSKLGEEIKEVESYGIKSIHVDVMDGHFVPNLSIGQGVIKSIRKHSDSYFDVHLMIDNPEKYIDSFIAAGADGITFHIEVAGENVYELIDRIKSKGKKVGISVNPATELPSVEILKLIDVLLVMTVNPGFGGQKYISEVNDKINKARQLKQEYGLNYKIEVDGGINSDTIKEAVDAGAEIIVAGNAIFGQEDREKAIRELNGGING